MALLVWPAAMAASREILKERRWERRWIIGQRSVERPRSVSTAFRGDPGILPSQEGDVGNGVEAGCVLAFGDVPRERAAITS